MDDLLRDLYLLGLSGDMTFPSVLLFLLDEQISCTVVDLISLLGWTVGQILKSGSKYGL